MQVEPWMLPEIAEVTRSPSTTGFVLRFFDSRVRDRVAKQVDNEEKSSDALSGSTTDHSNHGEPAKQRHVDLVLSEVKWADLQSGQEKRRTLRLRSLPAHFCAKVPFYNLLKTEGLEEAVEFVSFFPSKGRRPGAAVLGATSLLAVKQIVRYFHGRQWGRSVPVAVSFAAVQWGSDTSKTRSGATKKHAALDVLPLKLPQSLGDSPPCPSDKDEPMRIEFGSLNVLASDRETSLLPNDGSLDDGDCVGLSCAIEPVA
eukprot:TRINITY_DN56461_c0_g1_i1.p1 TRINITY_DN56461_c0_g1~~TRINITY_DN56461_c0_g1_i1.p1  ORF type:complete len:257 (-),score=66.55 TRINITY_DN56461_c0_g1_i1:141-911(-)